MATETEKKAGIDLAEQFRKNWVIIAFIASLIVGWTNIQNGQKVLQAQIDQAKLELTSLRLKQESADGKVAEISGDIKEINAKLTFISDQLTKK